MENDSRRVQAGDVFVACRGEYSDGRDYIAAALQQGAVAVLWDDADGFQWQPSWHVPNLAIPALRARIGVVLAHALHYPSQSLDVVGVTGTNGKTSITHWLAQAWQAAGHTAAVIGTVGNGLWGQLSPATHTTPDPLRVQYLLAQYRQAGAQAVAMEVSSHGLDQYRVNGVGFRCAVFTNLTRDHLDYHGDMKQYYLAKTKLFTQLKNNGLCVINIDDPYGLKLIEECHAPVISVGEDKRATVRISNINLTSTATTFDLFDTIKNEKVTFKTNVIAKFNVSNLALALVSVVHYYQKSYYDFVELTSKMVQVLGRMQRLAEGQDYDVIIDFAHTPDGFKQLYEYASKISKGRILTVFGSAGQRDVAKRKVFGEL